MVLLKYRGLYLERNDSSGYFQNFDRVDNGVLIYQMQGTVVCYQNLDGQYLKINKVAELNNILITISAVLDNNQEAKGMFLAENGTLSRLYEINVKNDMITFNTSSDDSNPMPQVNMTQIFSIKVAFPNEAVTTSCVMLKDRKTVLIPQTKSYGGDNGNYSTIGDQFPAITNLEDILFIALGTDEYKGKETQLCINKLQLIE